MPGERLLVLGASGGVGLTAVELGKLMGAEVIACARGKAKLEICRGLGADHLIDSETDDIREVVKSLGGADVVYDPIGGEQFKAALRACNPEARLLPLGFASGEVPQIPANILLVKNLTVMGLYWGGYAKVKPSVLTDSFTALFDWYVAGKLKPHVSIFSPWMRPARRWICCAAARPLARLLYRSSDSALAVLHGDRVTLCQHKPRSHPMQMSDTRQIGVSTLRGLCRFA